MSRRGAVAAVALAAAAGATTLIVRFSRRDTDEPPAPGGDSHGAQPRPISVDCGHPFVPSRVGWWGLFRTEGGGRNLSTKLSLVASEPSAHGEWTARFAVTFDAVAAGTLRRRCSASAGAEDPYFGYMPGFTGLVQGDAIWRLPAVLATGGEFGGETRVRVPVDPTGFGAVLELRVVRRHLVRRRERVAVPAGSFDAWRVDFAGEHATADHAGGSRGTIWLTERVGLVRAEWSDEDGTREQVLLAYGDP